MVNLSELESNIFTNSETYTTLYNCILILKLHICVITKIFCDKFKVLGNKVLEIQSTIWGTVFFQLCKSWLRNLITNKFSKA